MTTRYVVRDVATRGVDYLLWGDDDEVGARASLAEAQAMFGEDAVELVTMPAHAMDDHTRRLVEGAFDSAEHSLYLAGSKADVSEVRRAVMDGKTFEEAEDAIASRYRDEP